MRDWRDWGENMPFIAELEKPISVGGRPRADGVPKVMRFVPVASAAATTASIYKSSTSLTATEMPLARVFKHGARKPARHCPPLTLSAADIVANPELLQAILSAAGFCSYTDKALKQFWDVTAYRADPIPETPPKPAAAASATQKSKKEYNDENLIWTFAHLIEALEVSKSPMLLALHADLVKLQAAPQGFWCVCDALLHLPGR